LQSCLPAVIHDHQTCATVSDIVAHTVGLIENIPFATNYPVLNSTTTVLALPAHLGVHLSVPFISSTLVPAARSLFTANTTGATTQFKQSSAFVESWNLVSKKEFEGWLTDYCEATGVVGSQMS